VPWANTVGHGDLEVLVEADAGGFSARPERVVPENSIREDSRLRENQGNIICGPDLWRTAFEAGANLLLGLL
jgi:hypothetical protein